MSILVYFCLQEIESMKKIYHLESNYMELTCGKNLYIHFNFGLLKWLM